MNLLNPKILKKNFLQFVFRVFPVNGSGHKKTSPRGGLIHHYCRFRQIVFLFFFLFG